ncbi:putative nad dependent epimerase protein [Neofusicoccum parvum UCRNP2]|uniref:Putative nad dependent epimerase protein n=1 Tax=Botryosphaeria parva (strain UCR-NP2) TaxID=1287680 RepID=R1GDB4_BOTPV|nr:putative nad dependent epimerase protein [Neofusicoccum parvum UCRNP2]
MPSNIIAIVGATGKQGGSVATTYLSTPGWRVRCLTRSPSSPSAQALAARGAEIVRADVDDVASLRAAFAGAAAVFAVTDFWAPMFDAGNARAAAARGVAINEWCCELEARRGRNLALAAAATDGLRRELMSWKEYMKIWARVLGLKLAGDDGSGHKELSVEEAREAIEGSEELKMEAVESIQYVQEFGWTAWSR